VLIAFLLRADGRDLVASTHAHALCREALEVLVLTRKSNQSIMIGDDIEVSVLAIMGEKVRIGIEAPRSVPVFRKEVYVEIQQDRAAEDSSAEVDEALDRLKSPEGGSPPS
jgi:carbon storage regulator